MACWLFSSVPINGCEHVQKFELMCQAGRFTPALKIHANVERDCRHPAAGRSTGLTPDTLDRADS
jgi:hypothetical protein